MSERDSSELRNKNNEAVIELERNYNFPEETGLLHGQSHLNQPSGDPSAE